MKNVIFTICAKNYLSQALVLKQSLKTTNPDIDFVIFIADTPSGIEDEDVVFPNESWIPEWKNMAFKYNVIEYATSIKPFCINLLLEKYDNLVFVDPDTYATHSFDYIFDCLKTSDVMITPHYNNIQEVFTGAVPEEEILFVGIYNLGFLALKRSETTNKLIKWWMNRLREKCYADKFDALHVDQKWFDFIPAFFPDQVKISHHCGINTAIWNLHERTLVNKDGRYFVRNIETEEEFPLLFFHFSGFNPKNPSLINRRHPKYNTEAFPEYKPLFEEYTNLLFDLGYERFMQLSYGFNVFSNNEKIIPLHRRLYREIEKSINCKDPFNVDENLYKIFKESKLLTGEKVLDANYSNPNLITNRDSQIRKVFVVLKIFKKIIGVKYYSFFLNFFSVHYRFEKNTFLLNQDSVNYYSKKDA
ncbi:hypothetical protein [Desertivirga arenae]|uniref:hypothetical protein n=1 Tax=Desertivirga arenae TaxID=2810309 RepID=UPI001A978624|nr:hypothetical protein [Pedobacter sp. SYSU D00823]